MKTDVVQLLCKCTLNVMIDEKFAYISFFINCYYDQTVNVNKYALYR